MEYSELVASRRSIRAFKENDTITKADIEEMILCAQQAPTWKNSQTCRYYAITSPELLAKFKADTLPDFNQNSSKNAPAIIVTTFEKYRAGFDREGNPDNELGNEWGAYDLGLSNAYLILKARELGYDTLIMGLRDTDIIRTMLDVPESQEVVAVIAVGHREKDPVAPPRKELDSVARFF